MIVESHFKPLWWLANPHLQTVYASIRHPVQATVDSIERIDLPDGDFLDLAWSVGDLPKDAPLVVILHGLGGCLNSSYVARFMLAFNQRGWRSVLMLFRGAGDTLNRLPRSYHSGDTGDLNYIMSLITDREPHTKKAVVGVSLGGNVLLKWLGEQGKKAQIDAAVAISVPYVLNKTANRINIGLSRFYEKVMLKQLKIAFKRKLMHLTDVPEPLRRAEDCQCFWTFDQNVTAPLHGFKSAHEYYRQSSSRQFLQYITVPTLLIHAEDDPFMSVDVIPTERELSDSILLELSKKGGHVGFVSGTPLGMPVYWLDERVPNYLAEHLTR